MIWIACQCGTGISLPETFINEVAECPDCRRMLRVIGTMPADGSPGPEGDHRLIIRKGPQRAGEQIVLRGGAPIEIGKLPEKPLSLPGTLVSRNHCRLIPAPMGWTLEDQGSTNGVLVNGTRCKTHLLKAGDRVAIGEYELEYLQKASQVDELEILDIPENDFGEYELAEEEPAPSPTATRAPIPVLPLEEPGEPRPCPSCQKMLPASAKICIDCGIDLRTGRAILVSDGVDEDAIQENARSVVRWLSFVMPTGLYPIKSEGFGTSKPYVIWAIALLTTLVSVGVWIADVSNPQVEKNLALWAGRQPTADDVALGEQINVFTHWGNSAAFMDKEAQLRGTVPGSQLKVEAYRQLDPDQQFFGQFHWYQLITHGLLHSGILHLAGNLLFLLVFGSRVNALLGPVKTAILYPLLMIAAGIAEMTSLSGHAPLACLGASGAIMGLAGMYFVLFPIHRVFMVIWLRLGLIFGFKLLMKVFSLRGFWVVLFFISFDVLATVLGSRDGVAHWAHLGGFIAGMIAAIVLLVSRQVNAFGTDLISVLLGRHAWKLLGKPASRQVGAGVPVVSIATPLNFPG